MDTDLSYDNLSKQLNTTFEVEHEHADVQLELTEVSNRKLRERQEEFSIVFRGPTDRLLSQGMWSMKHTQLGEFELFIVPIRKQADGLYYEAIFNRFLDPV